MELHDTPDLTVIGIGASAGGLEALRELLGALPTEAAAAYVVVQHLAPQHDSQLAPLLARHTALPVHQISDGQRAQGGQVYVCPPNHDVIWDAGRLRLVPPSPDPAVPKPSVDRFLCSLAEGMADHAVGIVLSGTGRDGAEGIRAIRQVGGVTLAQNPESAGHDGMPRAALDTDCVDHVLRPADIGLHLSRLLVNAAGQKAEAGGADRSEHEEALLALLHARTGVDFTGYKHSTIKRRMRRRRSALGLESDAALVAYYQDNPTAIDTLFGDLLISVTQFFRDREAFEGLARVLSDEVPRRLAELGGGARLRIWVAGCATGEEVYSLAMLLCEALGGDVQSFGKRVQIFATDLDQDALSVARAGRYPHAVRADIPEALADAYLLRDGEGVRVIAPLRKAVLFSRHNLCVDPPLHRIDLMCCRNLLIYLDGPLQRQVLARLHRALTPDGMLFLGAAETVSAAQAMFSPWPEAPHLFHKRSTVSGQIAPSRAAPPAGAGARPGKDSAPSSADRQMLQALVRSLGPDAILVSESLGIRQVFGDVSPYVTVDALSSLQMHLDLLRQPLRDEARSMIALALKSGQRRTGVRHLLVPKAAESLRLDAYPVIAPEIGERCVLLTFTLLPPAEAPLPVVLPTATDGPGAALRVSRLEQELAATRAALQDTIEELETANDDLQLLNQELQASNEELQATNEELETTNEELQSTNEELISVNEELQIASTQLSGLSGELETVLTCSPMPILVTDPELRITRMTDSARDLFGLKGGGTGTHLSACALPKGYPSLVEAAKMAMAEQRSVSKDFVSDGARVTFVCAPYRRAEARVAGTTLTVTRYPGLADEMEMLLAADNIYLMHRGQDGTILRISDASARVLGASVQACVGRPLTDFLQAEDAERLLADDRAFLETGAQATTSYFRFRLRHTGLLKSLTTRRYRSRNVATGEPTVYAIASDVTDILQAGETAETALRQVELLQDLAGIGYWAIDLDAETVHWSREMHRIHRTDADSFVPTLENGLGFYAPEDREYLMTLLEETLRTGRAFSFRLPMTAADGRRIEVESHGVAILDPNGRTARVAGVLREH